MQLLIILFLIKTIRLVWIIYGYIQSWRTCCRRSWSGTWNRPWSWPWRWHRWQEAPQNQTGPDNHDNLGQGRPCKWSLDCKRTSHRDKDLAHPQQLCDDLGAPRGRYVTFILFHMIDLFVDLFDLFDLLIDLFTNLPVAQPWTKIKLYNATIDGRNAQGTAMRLEYLHGRWRYNGTIIQTRRVKIHDTIVLLHIWGSVSPSQIVCYLTVTNSLWNILKCS